MNHNVKLALVIVNTVYITAIICFAFNLDLISYKFSNIINQYFIISLFNVVMWITIIYFRWKYLEYKGMTNNEFMEILGNRKNFDLESYQLKYGNRTLIIGDGIFRKINHILTTIFNIIIITYYVDDDKDRLQLSILGQFTLLLLSMISYHYNTILAFLIYGSSARIRDGVYARLNILVVRTISLPSFIIIGTLLNVYKDELSRDEKKISIMMMYLPLIIGDAMGEIIGSLFGKHTFKVYGIGETNKKSYEGTLAVFLSSYISIIVMCIIQNVNNHTYLLGFFISLISTIIELIAIRSTDNFFIPIVNALILWVWTSNIETHLIN